MLYGWEFVVTHVLNTQEHLIENEVAVLRRVKHPNIIMLIEEVDTPTDLYLVMELVKVLFVSHLFNCISQQRTLTLVLTTPYNMLHLNTTYNLFFT